jgi:hypothetical protein
MAFYSESTKQNLLGMRDAIRDWVLSDQWLRGTTRPLVDRWLQFLRVEREGARGMGYGAIAELTTTNWRFYPYVLTSVEYLKKLTAPEMKLRAEVYEDLTRLVRYFDQWDDERSEPGPRGGVNPTTLVAVNSEVTKIRAKYASEAASLERAVIEAQQSVIDKALQAAAAEVGKVGVPGSSWDENAKAVVKAIAGNQWASVGLGALGLGMLAYVVLRGSR